MSHKGRVTNGIVILEDPSALPDGAEVFVEVINRPRRGKRKSVNGWKALLELAGTARGLSSDLARRHDYYLHRKVKK